MPLFRNLACAAGLLLALLSASPAQATLLGARDQPACSSTSHLGDANYAQFARWLGHKPDLALEFPSFASWNAMISSSNTVVPCWKAAGVPNIVYSVPMAMLDGSSTLQGGARGDYDAYYQKLAAILITNGYSHAILRVGWEFNLHTFHWAAAQDPNSYVLYFQHVVTAMRAVPGAHFTVDWNPGFDPSPNAPGDIPPDQVWPGDSYVDYVGMDVYNQWWGTAYFFPPAQRWNALVTATYGLQWQVNFAAAHHKPISFPEWGTGVRSDGHGMGDEALFVQNMAAWIKGHNTAYQVYWDQTTGGFDGQLSLGSKPNAAQAYLKAFR